MTMGGYAMMPLALALVVGELWLLARLTTPDRGNRAGHHLPATTARIYRTLNDGSIGL